MALLTVVCGLGLTGCQTAEGFGEDVDSAGEAISDAAEDVEEDLD